MICFYQLYSSKVCQMSDDDGEAHVENVSHSKSYGKWGAGTRLNLSH